MFGARIKQLREKKGLTQASLAHRVNVSGSAISQLENKIYPGNWQMLNKLASALECTIYDLIYDEEHIVDEFIKAFNHADPAQQEKMRLAVQTALVISK